MIEAPLQLQGNTTIPADHLSVCAAQGIATAGNAAGNTKDFLDLKGANVSPEPLPEGFTPRGIVAFTGTILSALLGCAVIVWYGMADIPSTAVAAAGGLVGAAK